jgi:hypothetical protein
MPWYEPATGAPKPLASERSDEQGAINVGSYLDEGWNYHPVNDDRRHRQLVPHNVRDRLTLDGFQHQVESQLSGLFPLADFSSSQEYTRHTLLSRSNCWIGGEDEENNHVFGNRIVNPNLKSEGLTHNIESKAAQFFHPRPVNFFSPLIVPSTASKGTNGDNLTDGTADVYLARKDSSHHQSQHTTSQQHHQRQQNNDQQLKPTDEVIQPTSTDLSHREPISGLKPKQLTNVFDSFVAKPSSKDPFQRPPRQAKLVQNSMTGELIAKSNSSFNPSKRNDKINSKSWDDYGGRPIDCAESGHLKSDHVDAKNKKKDKQNSRKNKNTKQPENRDIGDLLQRGTKRTSTQPQQEVGNQKQICTAAKSDYRSSINTVTELGIPINMEDISTPPLTGFPEISETEFDGIEQMDLQNAAQCMEGLQQFLSLVGRQKHVAFTILFLDPYTGNYTTSSCPTADQCEGQRKKKKHAGNTTKYTRKSTGQAFECTTPFLPTSKKYCTPKGPACSAWNCTCDDQIRGMRASAMLIGAMFVFQIIDGVNNVESTDSGWQCFLLPLGPTASQEEIEYERMSSWPTIPFQCDVSLSDRWSAFEAILLNGSTKLITYNATLSLLPFYYHLDNDVANQNHENTLMSFASCIAGTDVITKNQHHGHSFLRSVWDLRLASWMLRPEADDATLEFRTFQEGFSHFARDRDQGLTSDLPLLLQGLSEARINLELIHKLFPIFNLRLSDGGLLDAFERIETPVQSILASMESRGIGFFPSRIKRIEAQIESRIEELEYRTRSITNDPSFLLSSPQHVSTFLFDILKLQVPTGIISKTKAGSSHRSTSEEALQAIKTDMVLRTGSSPQLIDIILEFRQLNKLLTAFVRPLPKISRRMPSSRGSSKKSRTEPARIYPQWMQTAVRTGRLSCRKPNLQQIPKEGGEL